MLLRGGVGGGCTTIIRLIVYAWTLAVSLGTITIDVTILVAIR